MRILKCDLTIVLPRKPSGRTSVHSDRPAALSPLYLVTDFDGAHTGTRRDYKMCLASIIAASGGGDYGRTPATPRAHDYTVKTEAEGPLDHGAAML
eukprot:3591251-Pleurochrysis_carterae.AAC.1